MNIAIIVAAGSGSRFNSEQPKQFTPLLGKPVILHTLEKFEACFDIDEIVLVLSPSGKIQFETLGHGLAKLRCIAVGGETRAHSVKNGFDAANASETDVIAVHDGARPLVTADEISRTIQAAAEVGAACLVSPVTDTIKEIVGERISGTMDRSRLARALTPQAFRYSILEEAFAKNDLNEAVTDECYLVERLEYKYEIAAVTGSSRNIKITDPDDITIAEALISSCE
jgi:2-C-methyl-D-erythritol 4-phosphate cytidylyltransferase